MRASVKLVAAVMVLLCACGGSGGDGGSAPRDAACEGASCGPDDALPPAPLSCDSRNGGVCPQGYRCVDSNADSCDPATGVDCGVCVLGEELPGCGVTEAPCPAGSVCVDDTTDECDGGPAVDCPGVCRPEATGECTADADCPALPAVCNTCADGSYSCPTTRCDNGKCVVDGEACPQPNACGGGTACPEGHTCVDDPNDACDPRDGGADCPGLCEPGSSDGCSSDADCPPSRAPCQVCPDNTEVCPKSFCDNGKCGVVVPSCESPVACGDDADGCGPDETCVYDPDDPCDPATGAAGCKGVCVPIDRPRPCDAAEQCPAGYQCVVPDGTICDPDAAGAGCAGVCTPVAPAQCETASDCKHIVTPQGCAACPDGFSYSCPRVACTNGACLVEYEPCAGPDFCGGIAGFPCPPGLTCIDAPNDDCDPLRGGADCAGICVREEKPAICGGIAGTQCPDGYVCADDPGDDCDPSVGADCPGLCRPAPPSPCVSDEECPQSLAPCIICADGTAACPRSSCVNGVCHLDFETCAAER